MDVFKKNANMVLKIFGFLILFHNASWASNTLSSPEQTNIRQTVEQTHDVKETTTISLDSFSSTGMVLMLLLTSLLGAFFVKDEFGSLA